MQHMAGCIQGTGLTFPSRTPFLVRPALDFHQPHRRMVRMGDIYISRSGRPPGGRRRG